MPDEFADNGKSCKAYTEGRGGYEGREATRRRVGRRPPRQLAERGRYQPDTAAGYQGTGYPNGAGTRNCVPDRIRRPGFRRWSGIWRPGVRRQGLRPQGYPDSGYPGSGQSAAGYGGAGYDSAGYSGGTGYSGSAFSGNGASSGNGYDASGAPGAAGYARRQATRSLATRRPAQAVSMDGRRPRPGRNSFRRTSQRPGMITRRGPRAHTGGYPFSRCSTIRRRNSTGWRNAPPKEFARPSPTRWFMSSTWCPRRQCSGSSTRFTATARLLRAMSSSRIFSVSSPIAGLASSRRTLSTCG